MSEEFPGARFSVALSLSPAPFLLSALCLACAPGAAAEEGTLLRRVRAPQPIAAQVWNARHFVSDRKSARPGNAADPPAGPGCPPPARGRRAVGSAPGPGPGSASFCTGPECGGPSQESRLRRLRRGSRCWVGPLAEAGNELNPPAFPLVPLPPPPRIPRKETFLRTTAVPGLEPEEATAPDTGKWERPLAAGPPAQRHRERGRCHLEEAAWAAPVVREREGGRLRGGKRRHRLAFRPLLRARPGEVREDSRLP